MYLPHIASFHVVAQYVVEEEPDSLAGVLLDRIESHDMEDGTRGLGYLHLLWLVQLKSLYWFNAEMFHGLAEMGESFPLRATMPLVVLAAEMSGGPNSLQDQLSGDPSFIGPFFCAFDRHGHRNFGRDPEIVDPLRFEARALETIRAEHRLTLRRLPQIDLTVLPL